MDVDTASLVDTNVQVVEFSKIAETPTAKYYFMSDWLANINMGLGKPSASETVVMALVVLAVLLLPGSASAVLRACADGKVLSSVECARVERRIATPATPRLGGGRSARRPGEKQGFSRAEELLSRLHMPCISYIRILLA